MLLWLVVDVLKAIEIVLIVVVDAVIVVVIVVVVVADVGINIIILCKIVLMAIFADVDSISLVNDCY